MSIKLTVKGPNKILTDKGEIETEWKTPAGKLTTSYLVEENFIRVCTYDKTVCYYDSPSAGDSGSSENLIVKSGKAAPAAQD